MCSARQQAQQEGGSLLISLASCLLECVYSLIDYLTKFATVRMAITGEAFLEAARRATDLLARNFLKVCLTPLLSLLIPAAAATPTAACVVCWGQPAHVATCCLMLVPCVDSEGLALRAVWHAILHKLLYYLRLSSCYLPPSSRL